MPGYEYLADSCNVIMQWREEAQATNIDVAVWLARNGYDSPLAECGQKVTIDRRIKVGDMVALILWEDGALRLIKRIGSWDPIEGWTLGRVTHVEPSFLGLSSGGRWLAVPITKSPALDRYGYNVVGAKVKDDWYTVPLDPQAPVQTVTLNYPCWAGAKPEPLVGLQASIQVGQ